MEAFVGVMWDAARWLCGYVQRESVFVFDLEANLKLLEDESTKLEGIKLDVEGQIEEAQNNPDLKISHQVCAWQKRVEAIQQEIKDIEAQKDRAIQSKCLCKWCSKNCVSNYKLGKNVAKILQDLNELATEGKRFCNKDFIIVHEVPPKAVEMPTDETVGLDSMFDQVWNCIQAENVGVIGLYGMGGVGKTTLLKKINNELGKTLLGFNFVMWVVVSKEPNLDGIMDNIRKFVGIGDGIWSRCKNLDEKVGKIYGVLKRKKFALLLDDIWDQLDLKLVGVPHPRENNFQSKVLLTTRLEDVCAKMQAERTFKLETLTEVEASELFRMKVGESTLSSHPSIPELAEEMAKECNRLPLALIVVGSAMAGVKSVEAWKYSIKNLTSSLLTAQDLEKKVFSILKFSYDRLDEAVKLCFLYCALYPEDSEIQVLDLIDEWIWEKFLCKDLIKSVEDMRGYGESIIEKLKLSCLLETVEDDIFMNRAIKMHDTIRDMALWVAHDQDNMKLVPQISIMERWESRKILDPPNATTLILLEQHVQSQQFLEGFKYMKRLKVLKLKVRQLELSVDIGGLVSLEYLSLEVREFQQDFFNNLQYLTNLKFVSLLSYSAFPYDRISLGVLSSLQQLRVLRLDIWMANSEERRILEELESLPNIEELCININGRDGLKKLMETTKLRSWIRKLHIRGKRELANEIEMNSLLSAMSRMKQLEQIYFTWETIGSGPYSRVFNPCCLTKLRKVTLEGCSVIHVTWLRYAPLLQELGIFWCESMEEVIEEEEEEEENNVDSPIFSSLVTMTLEELPRLKSIHKSPLPFSFLKSIKILKCPKLKKLPLNSNSSRDKATLIIKGEHAWWNNLAWEDSAARDRFGSKFQAWH